MTDIVERLRELRYVGEAFSPARDRRRLANCCERLCNSWYSGPLVRFVGFTNSKRGAPFGSSSLSSSKRFGVSDVSTTDAPVTMPPGEL